MIVVTVSAAYSAYSALVILLRYSLELMIVCQNRVQSAVHHARFGILLGIVRFRWMVYITWLEVESGLILCIRIFSVMYPAEKQRSMTDSLVLFQGKWVGCLGLLCRKKW
jgi:hypothetical protein